MAFRDWSTTALLADVRRKAWLPDSDLDFTDSVILTVADEVIETVLVPVIRSQREEFFVQTEDVAIVANQTHYQIPRRAHLSGIRSVHYLDSSGNGTPMSQVSLDEIDLYGGSSYGSGYPPMFALESDRITLVPTPASSVGTIRFRFYRRPSRLVASSAVDTVSSVNAAIYEFSRTGSNVTAGTNVDFYRKDPTFRPLADSSAISTGASLQFVTSAAQWPTGLAVGDFVAKEGETHIPQLPADVMPALAWGVAAQLLSERGDAEHYVIADREFKEKLGRLASALSPRVTGQTKKLINHNSPLRNGRGRFPAGGGFL